MTHKAHYWNVILLQNVYSKMLEIVTGCFVFTAGRATWQITKKKKKSSALIIVRFCWMIIHVTCILGNYK